jgi:hypothetical protein
MLDQLVAAGHFAVTLTHITAVILISFRWSDAFGRELRWSPEVTLIACWIAFSVAAAVTWLYWTLRWFVKADAPTLSAWYVRQAWITVPFGVWMSLAVAGAGAAMLWPTMRWRGLGLAAATVTAIWILSLWTVGLI